VIDLVPGQPPPWLIPFCASCDQPVEKFTVHDISNVFFVTIEAQCHGRTEGMKIRLEGLDAHDKGERIVMFKKKAFNAVR
jgi:hypothetical protein